ncbi:hypothetical protein Cgig2_010636 [Carnegiea gigantea]|uniref:Uncharacterized protein n=1 Tax=Carnegiea gigantea TaxID=171969 RepID=A0A9Q1JI10_9CARY|nr:hypothetical protein Cgig2_010636 [Carnegiea gigantea]
MSFITNDSICVYDRIRKPIVHFSKSKCHEGPLSLPSWSKEILKTGEIIFTLKSPCCPRECSITPSRNHERNFHSTESFLIPFSIGNGWRMFSLVVETYWLLIICSMPFMHRSFFMTSVQILFDKLFAYLERKNIYFSSGHLWLLRLPFSGFVYDEIVPPSKELKTSLGRSCGYLFTTYHILRQWLDHKPTIEEWITFRFRGPIKYHAPMKSGHRSRAPLLTNVYLTTKIYGWNESHAVFDELGCPEVSVHRLSLRPVFHVGCASSYFQSEMLIAFALGLSQ